MVFLSQGTRRVEFVGYLLLVPAVHLESMEGGKELLPFDVLVFRCRPWRLQSFVVESHSAWWSVGCIDSLSVDADGPGSLPTGDTVPGPSSLALAMSPCPRALPELLASYFQLRIVKHGRYLCNLKPSPPALGRNLFLFRHGKYTFGISYIMW